jgi:hypothetical protein
LRSSGGRLVIVKGAVVRGDIRKRKGGIKGGVLCWPIIV